MSERLISLDQASATDLDRVETFLGRNDLPAADVRAGPAEFYLATVDGEFVGVGGLEVHGSTGLLRSVVVRPPYRGRGLGAELVAQLEERAVDAGVDSLYLLTTTAAPFFERQGYEVIDRHEAPPAVRDTTEFQELCPDSATCLTKDL